MERIKRILIVDDCNVTRNVVQSMITTFHPAVSMVHAHHGAHAWEMINDHGKEFDMVITDQRMPEMGGVELADRIRKLYPEVHIILMSGDEEPQNHSAHAFLSKPFRRVDLMVAVKNALQRAK